MAGSVPFPKDTEGVFDIEATQIGYDDFVVAPPIGADTVQEAIDLLKGGGGGSTTLQVFSDATRPAPNLVPAGRMIFNTDDNDYNVSNGTNWYNAGVIT